MKNILKNFILLTILGLSNYSIAQKVQTSDSCTGWQTIDAKNENVKVLLQVLTSKDGQKMLQWTNPSKKDIKFDIYRAKAMTNSQGKIDICTTGHSVYVFINEDTYAVQKFNDGKMLPGYYAIRIVLGPYPGNQSGQSHDYSNWVTVQIK